MVTAEQIRDILKSAHSDMRREVDVTEFDGILADICQDGAQYSGHEIELSVRTYDAIDEAVEFVVDRFTCGIEDLTVDELRKVLDVAQTDKVMRLANIL